MRAEEPSASIVREWLRLAAEDLDVSARALEPPAVPRSAAFHAQQAAEKAFKAFLISRGQTPGRTHDLAALLGACLTVDPGLAVLEASARMLSPFALTGRYPDVDSSLAPDEQQAKEALRAARHVVQFVLDRLPPEVRS